MSEISFEIPIPLDEDGFIEMECDYCKSRFMLHENVFKNEDYLHFFCPICGLPNNIQSFYCPEVLDKAEQMIGNYMTDYMNQLFSDFNKSNNNDFFSMSIEIPQKEHEKELYTPPEEYDVVNTDCCSVDVKVRNIDKEIGIYCPICGGTYL